MARKSKDVVVKEGRDKDKVFRISEASAWDAEDWALRLFLALAKNGVSIPPDIAQAGLAGVSSLGLRLIGQVAYEEAKPLLDEMMACVKIVPDPHRSMETARPLLKDDIEDVKTLLMLKQEVIEIHTGFSVADALSTSAASAMKTLEQTSPNTGTSLAPSAPSSPPAKRH